MFTAGALGAADDLYSLPASSAAVQFSSAAAAAPEEPFVSPLGFGKGHIVSGFGKRKVPNDTTKAEMHDGVDFAVLPGDSIKAARAGKVLFAGFSRMYVSRKDKTDQAHLIIIRHADGKSSRYVHLNALRVRPMQEVTAGQVIGTASESDEWTQPVLHFEIRDAAGKPMNPGKFVSDLKR